jgi:hypothetical protein
VFSVVPTVLGNVVPKHEQQISKNNDKKLHAPDVNSLPYICRNAQERKKITSPALYGNEIPKSGIYKCPPGLDIVKHTYIKTSKLEQFTTLKVFDKCPIQCFLGYYILINILTTIHRDVKDPPDGWVAMVVLGKFTGGHLYIPDLDIY